ncbi:unnamed protein product, partial [Enterobius vermicularis]|uniref:non-specific serine/threonine protein kinase n=1 Tax=Enterobius vermicularis TaxID=51028 RepID=A0A0N4UZG0_ENTVE
TAGGLFKGDGYWQFYFLLKTVGKGGFGTVYLAKRLRDNKEVAIKKIPRDKALSKNVKKEINALKQLEHSTIIEFYDEFVDGGVQYIVMEYCPHGSLRDYVLNHEKLPKDCVAYVLRRLVSGVMYIHSMNMVHRDLSAQNILICDIRRHGILEVVNIIALIKVALCTILVYLPSFKKEDCIHLQAHQGTWTGNEDRLEFLCFCGLLVLGLVCKISCSSFSLLKLFLGSCFDRSIVFH